MGTNYYCKRILTEDEINSIHTKLDELIKGDIYKYEFDEALENLIKDIHLCKCSFGWKVNFDHNWGKYYELNRDSITKFLEGSDKQIVDEYGGIYTINEFWDIVDSHNSNPKNIYTSASYKAEYPGGFIPYDDINKCKEVFGIDSYGNSDFERDGLRFAVFSDFA